MTRLRMSELPTIDEARSDAFQRKHPKRSCNPQENTEQDRRQECQPVLADCIGQSLQGIVKPFSNSNFIRF